MQVFLSAGKLAWRRNQSITNREDTPLQTLVRASHFPRSTNASSPATDVSQRFSFVFFFASTRAGPAAGRQFKKWCPLGAGAIAVDQAGAAAAQLVADFKIGSPARYPILVISYELYRRARPPK